ncbi:enoyl-CoA hydratase-related protein [Marinimicrococcus flavescens]|uniref:Enoyl-CoA hydratase-related protein n=1 Tax=Marinimicrococcus flavescens TaxID=3031815 RepID=A0AAP4D585_9PROT|nr:enoyl-CoA hydratase-related protein [Marinimicrococcus flavescens]
MAGTITVDMLEPGIARVLIDHQERLNAMSVAMWRRMGEIMQELDADASMRCVILRGAGDKAFGAGADISEFEQTRSSAAQAREYAGKVHGTLVAVRECRHPVIAAINGLCVGGGLELATCADLRIAGESSRYGIPVKRLGLVVAYDEMRGLIDLVGKANALRILLEGDILHADEALRMGLVNRLVPDAELDARVLDSARRIAEGAPLVARWHKKFANRLMDPRPLSAEENDESFHCFDTEDFKIGSRSFLAKEKPSFKGR